MERPPDAPLPARFQIGNMATLIADSNANDSEDDSDSNTRTNIRLAKTSIPTLIKDRDNRPQPTQQNPDMINTAMAMSQYTETTQKASLSTITSDLNRFMQGYTPHCHRINQTFRNARDTSMKYLHPIPEPQRGQHNLRRRWAYDPYTKCHACGQTGHMAVQCDTLAMAILIRKYMKESGNATAMK